jgi:formylglycine-generating enzyme required for sulfatase activity
MPATTVNEHAQVTYPPTPFAPYWATGWGEDECGLFAEFDLAGIEHRMRWIGPGTFMMGSPENEPGRYDDETLHQVALTHGFWLGETACTQAMWEAVMGDNPSHFRGADRPVEQVSWDDCRKFLDRANELVPEGGLRFPAEAEWECACRAGTTSAYSFGESITAQQVNHNLPWDTGETVDVKARPRNGWGLYQMHGNVWEWCADWLGDYPKGPVEDPTGPRDGAVRVIRGGSWFDGPGDCRSACRGAGDPGDCGLNLGFRLARGQ